MSPEAYTTVLEQLRQTLRALEKSALLEDAAGFSPLGIESIDVTLGGGLACGALHEIAAVSEAHLTAATGFVLGLVSPSPRLRGEGQDEGAFRPECVENQAS